MSSIKWNMFVYVWVCVFFISHISNLFHSMEWLMSLIYNNISVHRYLHCVHWRPCILITLDHNVNFGSSSNIFKKTWEPLLKYLWREIILQTKISFGKGSYTPRKHYLKRYFSTTRTPNKKRHNEIILNIDRNECKRNYSHLNCRHPYKKSLLRAQIEVPILRIHKSIDYIP